MLTVFLLFLYTLGNNAQKVCKAVNGDNSGLMSSNTIFNAGSSSSFCPNSPNSGCLYIQNNQTIIGSYDTAGLMESFGLRFSIDYELDNIYDINDKVDIFYDCGFGNILGITINQGNGLALVNTPYLDIGFDLNEMCDGVNPINITIKQTNDPTVGSGTIYFNFDNMCLIESNDILKETFDGNLSLWMSVNNSANIVNDTLCPNAPCLSINGPGGNISVFRYAETSVNVSTINSSFILSYDMYFPDLELNDENEQNGDEFAGIMYSIDNGNTFLDGPIIRPTALDNFGENQLYRGLNVTINNTGNIDSIIIRLVAYVSTTDDEVLFDNIRLIRVVITGV